MTRARWGGDDGCYVICSYPPPPVYTRTRVLGLICKDSLGGNVFCTYMTYDPVLNAVEPRSTRALVPSEYTIWAAAWTALTIC